MPIEPTREIAAWEIARRRRAHARQTTTGKWQAFDPKGTAVSQEADDPVEALEQAEVAIQAGERKEAELRIRRLYRAAERGVYAPWPKLDQQGNQEWVVLKTADRSKVAGPFGGYLAALVEIARLLDEPAPVLED